MPHANRLGWIRLLAVTLLVTTIGSIGCSNKTSDKNLSMVSVADGTEMVRGSSKLFGLGERTGGVWVDARDAKSFAEGHIPGALHLPIEEAKVRQRELSGFDAVIVYGASYNSPIASALAKMLIENGVKNVRVLNGGVQAWEAAGNELEASPDEG